MHRNRIRDLLALPPGETPVTAAGWVRTRRDSKGGFSFLELNDGSCFANLQVVADRQLSNYEADVLRLHPGASVSVQGRLVASAGAGPSLASQPEVSVTQNFWRSCDETAWQAAIACRLAASAVPPTEVP